jgi:AAA15 family ATPase/GTPase
MLLQFSVENFKSFKEKAILSMSASKDQEHVDAVASVGKNTILKTIAMYGANASGKTNMIKAFTAAIMLLRQSNNMQINQPLAWISPFVIDKETALKPSAFEFIFFVNEIKYIYGFSATINDIVDEYLYVYNSAKPSKVFERTNITEYSFPADDKRKLEEIKAKNSNNKLFLATATSWNYEKTKDAYLWFAESIDTFDRNSWDGFDPERFASDSSGSLKRFVQDVLKMADININDYSLEETDIPKEIIEELKKNVAFSEFIKNGSTKGYSISVNHSVENEAGDIENYRLDLTEESLGTQRLFGMTPHLQVAFKKGKTIIVDELENSLHPLLVEEILKMFNNPTINEADAQLIFNTHDVNLLSLDNFRRDQIYFLEKNPKTASSEIYSLDEFSVRKRENIRKGYLQGRYGAVPFIGGGASDQ